MSLRRPLLRASVAAGALLLGACADDARTPLAPEAAPAPRSAAAAVRDPQAEAAALDQVTRAVALALADQGLRQRVRNDLRESRHTVEHKLAFTDYVKGNSGGILLAKMAKETGRSREELLSLLGSVRPLEFYMPVDAHRESWTGGEVIVASLLEDDAGAPAPVGYAAGGARVALSAVAAPSTPALVLAPVETDFTRPVDAKVKNVNDRGGESIGTWGGIMAVCQDCEPTGGGGGGGDPVPVTPAGLYMTFNQLVDYGEPWTKGDPELEVHIHGPASTTDPLYGADLSCAGEKAAGYRWYDQNKSFWSGQVQLFTKAQVDDFKSKFPDGFQVMVWEDDDTSCTIKANKDNLRGALVFTKDLFGVAATVISGNYVVAAGQFVAAIYASADWLASNDDWLGVALPSANTGHYYGDANHELLKGGSNSGRINLVMIGV